MPFLALDSFPAMWAKKTPNALFQGGMAAAPNEYILLTPNLCDICKCVYIMYIAIYFLFFITKRLCDCVRKHWAFSILMIVNIQLD